MNMHNKRFRAQRGSIALHAQMGFMQSCILLVKVRAVGRILDVYHVKILTRDSGAIFS